MSKFCFHCYFKKLGNVALLYTWNYHNIVSQPYPNIKQALKNCNNLEFHMPKKKKKWGNSTPKKKKKNSSCFLNYTEDIKGFPGGSDGKRIHLQYGKPGFNPWVGKIPWRRAWQPTPVFLLGESPWTEEACGLTVHGVTKSRTWLGH